MDDKNYAFSEHLKLRIKERELQVDWILDVINNPDSTTTVSDIEQHFFKRINEAGGRCLKVVINPSIKIVITAHFDRKRTKNNCQ